MSDDTKPILGDPLAVGLTRPPMFMGVNIRYFFGNIVVSTLICVDAHTMLGIPLFMLLHFVMVNLSVKEPNFLTLYFQSFFKTPPLLNRQFWGGINSYEPW